MGVKGLNSFFNEHPEHSKRFKLHDSQIVLDGNNICCTLYFNRKTDCLYGGEYEKYANTIKKYFSIFLECNIEPIIIFDGGYEGRKWKTLISRTEDRLKKVKKIVSNGYASNLLPIMAHKIFYSILIELGIPFAQSDFEADDQLAALANYYNCPLISNDSDFYIFDIHCGFIRLDSVSMKINRVVDSHGKQCKFLYCDIYYADEFVSHFPGLDKKVLPLFGTLLGNDFMEDHILDGFFMVRNISDSKQEKITGLLYWLQNNTIDEVNHYFEENKQGYIKDIIENSVDGYKLNNCSLSFIIDKKLNNLRNKLPLYSRLSTRCGSPLPAKFVVECHLGKLPRMFINAITHHKVFLNPQVVNINFSNSYTSARYIRQILYGILFRHYTKNGNCENEYCLSSVEEYGRQGDILDSETVKPVFAIKGFGMLPNINEIYCLPKKKCKEIIFKVLGITSDFVSDLPEEWQLFVACINYWLRNCTAHPSEAFIYAIILNLIYYYLVKYRTYFPHKTACTKKTSLFTASSSRGKIFTISICTCSISCILSNVEKSRLYDVKKIFENRIKKPFDKDSLDIIHGYNELQACLLTVIRLNDLLGNSMTNPAPEFCLNGTVLHNFTQTISTFSNPEGFVTDILGQYTNLYLLYIHLISKVCENVPGYCVLNNSSQRKIKKYDDSMEKKV